MLHPPRLTFFQHQIPWTKHNLNPHHHHKKILQKWNLYSFFGNLFTKNKCEEAPATDQFAHAFSKTMSVVHVHDKNSGEKTTPVRLINSSFSAMKRRLWEFSSQSKTSELALADYIVSLRPPFHFATFLPFHLQSRSTTSFASFIKDCGVKKINRKKRA